MVEIQVAFPEPLSEFIQGQISAGRCASISDYLGGLVRADRQQQAVLKRLQDHEELASRLDEGLNAGEGRPWNPAVLHELRQQVLDRHCRGKELR